MNEVIYDASETQTSIDQYRDMIESGELAEKQEEVLKALKSEGPCTRRELRNRQLPSWELSSISGRTKELIEMDLIEVKGTKICGESGNKAQKIKARYP